ncbi:MAG TPA: tetratricopeptide repeat protein [Bryobacteraceae bacterium]|nr:tetratricopeptide repeat protein [Bryobacteraceae bacterium]
MLRLSAIVVTALPLFAQCRLPDVAPDALSRLTPAELIDAGHYLSAEKVLEPLAEQRPADAQIAWLLSRTKAALGQFDEAMTLADAALRSDPSNAAYHVQVAAVAGRLAEKAGLLKQLSFARRARQELDAALALDAANTDANWGMMMFYYAAPGLIGGDKAKARQIGEQLAATAPDLGRYYQGRLAIEMKDFDTAESFFRLAALENPLLFDDVAALAAFYMDKKPDQARAERWACQAVHADATRGDAWALLARVYAMCGCWTEAVEIARRAEAIDPENLSPYYAIAAVAVTRGEQLEMAAEFLRKYLSQPVEGNQPAEALAHMQLGLAMAQMGKTRDALPELKAALQQDSTLEPAKTELKRLSAELRR